MFYPYLKSQQNVYRMACRMGLTATALESDEWRQKTGGALLQHHGHGTPPTTLEMDFNGPPLSNAVLCVSFLSHALDLSHDSNKS